MINNLVAPVSVLYVEDDASLAMVTSDALQRFGYQITHCNRGVQAMELFLKGQFHLCLIDVQLPDIDGYSLARVIRSKDQDIPLLFLSGRHADADRLEGYKAGGDDYITKPYSIEEIRYKIDIFFKRSHTSFIPVETNGELTIGAYRLDADNYCLQHKEDKRKLTALETNLLGFLIGNKNKLVKRHEILQAVWGISDDNTSRSLDVFISRLRKYMESDTTIRLESHKGVGYKLSEL